MYLKLRDTRYQTTIRFCSFSFSTGVLNTCFLHDFISPISQSDSHDVVEEEEEEEKNSNPSAQHFLPGNPRTQAFPCQTSVDRKWSWILAKDSFDVQENVNQSQSFGYKRGGARTTDCVIFKEAKLLIGDLSADMSSWKRTWMR